MIVRYRGNRRLFDTETHRFITLAELAEQVAEGHELHIFEVLGRGKLQEITARIYVDILQVKAREGAVKLTVDLRRIVREACQPE